MGVSSLTLTEALDIRAAAPLLDALRGLRGGPLSLDGARVERLGGQCLQVLMCAHAAWVEDGVAFEIHDPSTALKDAWMLMGANPLPSFGLAPPETAQ